VLINLDFGLIGLWSNSRAEFLNGFERDASVHPRSFHRKGDGRGESLCSRTLRDTEVDNRAALPCWGHACCTDLLFGEIFRTFIPRTRVQGALWTGQMQTRHKQTL
jgi:hypothetical protein